jgi:hypothetical protein
MMLRQVPLSEYRFDSPAVVQGGQLNTFVDPSAWATGDSWVVSLENLSPPPEALVIPLELPSERLHLQDLLGYELFSALRWSGTERLRGVPVLLAAWQPFDSILRKKLDLLIVQPAVEFARLPEALWRLPDFLNDVSQGTIRTARPDEIAELSLAGDRQARRVSYHDLANDYYAALRLKLGYLALLKKGMEGRIPEAKAEFGSMSGVRYAWEAALEAKLRSPLVRRFQASRHGASAPRYPVIEADLDILKYHIQEGLPRGTRILLVDDEFHKGFADVLLRILFRQTDFTKQLKDEWVYSETCEAAPQRRWARFVCVRNADLAANWLAWWEGIAIDEVSRRPAWRDWLANWDRELNPDSKRRNLNPTDVFAHGRGLVLDLSSAGPRIKSTIVLLDLRLDPVRETLYSIRDFSSFGLRKSIKGERPDLPVIIFTASRQVLNFAELLDSSSEIDGWFIKEGPDIPVDAENTNSANAAAYLLERLHLYSTLRGWYRPSFDWTTERKLAYARLFHSKCAKEAFSEISAQSHALFRQILDRNWEGPLEVNDTYWAFIQRRVPPVPFPICQTLVARRVALAALLWTADMTPAGPEWNAEKFASLLPGRPINRLVKWVYDKLNFNQVLWMRSSDVLSQLLKEEIDWLETIEWPPTKKRPILDALSRERQRIEL